MAVVIAENITRKLISYANLIKFSHSIFALPFALGIYFYLWLNGYGGLLQLIYIVVAMVSARTVAMSFNRIADYQYDKNNPRTKTREIPLGIVSLKEAWAILIFSLLIFLASALMLGKHTFLASPVIAIILLSYSYAKRFTMFSHYHLGISLGLAPLAVWFALLGRVDIPPLILCLAITFWVAGFDILYALQDVSFDRKHNLFSIPAILGESRALDIAKLNHILAFILVIAFGLSLKLNIFFYLLTIGYGLTMVKQHILINRYGLSKINQAFFHQNALGSLIFLTSIVLGS